jgi:hypothetical protein
VDGNPVYYFHDNGNYYPYAGTGLTTSKYYYNQAPSTGTVVVPEATTTIKVQTPVTTPN